MMRQQKDYKGYQIVGDERGGAAQAVVLSGDKRVGPGRFQGVSVDAAMTEAEAWVDSLRAESARDRRGAHIASPAEYEEYFKSVELTDYERTMLTLHAKRKTLTAGELSDAVGWQDYRGANRFYGGLGFKIAKRFGLKPLSGNQSNEVWTTILAEGREGQGAEYYRWTVHPEVVEGMVAAGLLEKPSPALPVGDISPDPFAMEDPDVWLTSMWGFEPVNWGFLGFTDEADRRWFHDQARPGCLVGVYVTETSRHYPNQRGKLAGFLQLGDELGFAREFMPGDAYARKEADKEEAGRWNYAIGAVRAWQIPELLQPRIEDFAPETVGPASGDGSFRRLIAKRCTPFHPSEIDKLKDLSVFEVPCFGGRKTFDTTPGALERKVRTSNAVPRTTEPYTVEEDDGPKHLYILQLEGNLTHFLGWPADRVDGYSVIKVGYSGNPNMRCHAFNKALPDCAFRWKVLKVEDGDPPWANWMVAEFGENAMKYQLQKLAAEPLGGEFFLATSGEIEHAWISGGDAARIANPVALANGKLSRAEFMREVAALG